MKYDISHISDDHILIFFEILKYKRIQVLVVVFYFYWISWAFLILSLKVFYWELF